VGSFTSRPLCLQCQSPGTHWPRDWLGSNRRSKRFGVETNLFSLVGNRCYSSALDGVTVKVPCASTEVRGRYGSNQFANRSIPRSGCFTPGKPLLYRRLDGTRGRFGKSRLHRDSISGQRSKCFNISAAEQPENIERICGNHRNSRVVQNSNSPSSRLGVINCLGDWYTCVYWSRFLTASAHRTRPSAAACVQKSVLLYRMGRKSLTTLCKTQSTRNRCITTKCDLISRGESH
jgi:hypothetical protein